jgi:hypothetical protein
MYLNESLCAYLKMLAFKMFSTSNIISSYNFGDFFKFLKHLTLVSQLYHCASSCAEVSWQVHVGTFTDLRLSRWLINCINSVLGFLYFVVVGDVADNSECVGW